MRTWHYKIDEEGVLWHEGTAIRDPSVLKFFMRRMKKDKKGHLEVICQGELNLIEAEDVPYVIQEIQQIKDRIRLIFPGGYSENLVPTTLFVGSKNVLYCKIRNGEFTARFNRKSYTELTHLIECDRTQKKYYLVLGKDKYLIRNV